MRFIIYLKVQCIPNLDPLKIYNECYKFKNETIKKNCKKYMEIDHVITHMFLSNHNKIHIIIELFVR